jgi:membrane associated rhomboid family serine protease/tetratricopeptide (TPR) repeat protein
MTIEPPDPFASEKEVARPEGPALATARLEVSGGPVPIAAHRLWVTPTIIGLNVVVYLAMCATGVSPMSPSTGDLFKWGANFGPAGMLDGQGWRLLTCAFVHVGLLHLGFNMYAFVGAGAWMERALGSVAFFALYLVAALGGSLVSTIWSPLVVSAGASGAVFGVYGALLAFAQAPRENMTLDVERLQKSAIGFIAYNLFYGLTQPNIGNSAHIGGLVTGFVAGWLLVSYRPTPAASPKRAYLRLVGILPALAGLAAVAHWRTADMPSVRAHRLAMEAAAAVDARDWAKARRRFDQAIAINPRDTRLYLSRGYTREMTDDHDGAISDYTEAISRNPKDAAALTQRCVALVRKRDYGGAAKDCEAALALDGANPEAWHRLVEIRRWNGQGTKALEAAARLTQLSPQYAHGHLLMAELMIDKGDLEAAEGQLRKARDLEPNDPQIAKTRIHLLEHRGDFEAAQKEHDHAISLAPKDPAAYAARARNFRAQHDLERALADEGRAVELDPNNGAWHNGRAWTLLALGRLREALVESERSLALTPDDGHSMGTRCWIRVSLGDRSAGKADCARAVKLVRNVDTDQGMIDFLEGRYGDAATAWRRASGTHPADAAFLETWIAKAKSAERRASNAR